MNSTKQPPELAYGLQKYLLQSQQDTLQKLLNYLTTSLCTTSSHRPPSLHHLGRKMVACPQLHLSRYSVNNIKEATPLMHSLSTYDHDKEMPHTSDH